VIEQEREIDAEKLMGYLPSDSRSSSLPMVVKKEESANDFSEREILYKVLFDMKSDLTDLKKLVLQMIRSDGQLDATSTNSELMRKVFDDDDMHVADSGDTASGIFHLPGRSDEQEKEPETLEVEETLSLQDTEKELIKKALKKHNNKRKYAASELGISERTLYRKIKEYDLNN
jgi:DNA-binding NtrC family response regulator